MTCNIRIFADHRCLSIKVSFSADAEYE